MITDDRILPWIGALIFFEYTLFASAAKPDKGYPKKKILLYIERQDIRKNQEAPLHVS